MLTSQKQSPQHSHCSSLRRPHSSKRGSGNHYININTSIIIDFECEWSCTTSIYYFDHLFGTEVNHSYLGCKVTKIIHAWCNLFLFGIDGNGDIDYLVSSSVYKLCFRVPCVIIYFLHFLNGDDM